MPSKCVHITLVKTSILFVRQFTYHLSISYITLQPEDLMSHFIPRHPASSEPYRFSQATSQTDPTHIRSNVYLFYFSLLLSNQSYNLFMYNVLSINQGPFWQMLLAYVGKLSVFNLTLTLLLTVYDLFCIMSDDGLCSNYVL